jgi:hypothetical protein
VARGSGRSPSGAPVEVTVRRQARDQIGHWVAPPGMRAHPCPHRCCQNKQVHPDALPVKLDRAYLRSLSDEEVDRELGAYHRYADERTKGYVQVIAEAQRREDRQATRERAGDRRRRATSDYQDEVYRQWLGAENGIQGSVMLNKAGQRAGISERSLFTGPQSRVNRYASDELKEWFESHPRMTRAEWDKRSRREARGDSNP